MVTSKLSVRGVEEIYYGFGGGEGVKGGRGVRLHAILSPHNLPVYIGYWRAWRIE